MNNIPEYGDAQEELEALSTKWQKEVKAIYDKYGSKNNLTAFQAIGYKELFEYVPLLSEYERPFRELCSLPFNSLLLPDKILP